MKKITEDHIEKFVRFPELLSRDEKEKVGEAISHSKELRDLADWFKHFYADLDKVRAVASKHVIYLEPFQHVSDKNSKSRLMILAAKSKNSEKVPLETIATFVSEEEQTVVRVLYKHNTEEYQIHLLREEEANGNELYILSIDGVTDFVIDSSRHISFTLDGDVDSIDWQSVTMSLRSPVGSFEFNSKDFANTKNGKPLLKCGFHIEQETDGNSTNIKFKKTPSRESVNWLLVQKEAVRYEIYQFDIDSCIQISLKGEQQSLDCWFFQ